MTQDRIAQITLALNQQFAGENVRFVTSLSDLSDLSDWSDSSDKSYSTIYIGKTSSFEPYGSFAGLAETVDYGNKIKNDNAFVILDSTADNQQIISTIVHEAGHILGTLDHGGEGLQKYALYGFYQVFSGETSTGIVLDYHDSMCVYDGGTANSTVINTYGELWVSEGGMANSTTLNDWAICMSTAAVRQTVHLSNPEDVCMFMMAGMPTASWYLAVDICVLMNKEALQRSTGYREMAM